MPEISACVMCTPPCFSCGSFLLYPTLVSFEKSRLRIPFTPRRDSVNFHQIQRQSLEVPDSFEQVRHAPSLDLIHHSQRLLSGPFSIQHSIHHLCSEV